eukprot:jgi/Tetstr1/456733/TSEL_043430.t1
MGKIIPFLKGPNEAWKQKRRHVADEGQMQVILANCDSGGEGSGTLTGLELDLHTLVFVLNLDDCVNAFQGAKLRLPWLTSLAVHVFSSLCTVSQTYMVWWLWTEKHHLLRRFAVFSSSDNQELPLIRVLASALIFCIVMPEINSAVRTLITWRFTSGASGVRRALMWGVVVPMFLSKIVVGVGVGVVAVYISFSSPDAEGAVGVLMNFTALLIIMDLDNLMLPLTVEMADRLSGNDYGSLEEATGEFLASYRIGRSDRARLNHSRKVYRWAILGVNLLLAVMAAVFIYYMLYNMGICHTATDFTVERFTTRALHFWPECTVDGKPCMNGIYNFCSNESKFCDDYRAGKFDGIYIPEDLMHCQPTTPR